MSIYSNTQGHIVTSRPAVSKSFVGNSAAAKRRKSETARRGNPKHEIRQPCCPVSSGQSETNSNAPNPKSETGLRPASAFRSLEFWVLDLFRISGTTPGNRRPPAAELSCFGFRISCFGFAVVVASADGDFGLLDGTKQLVNAMADGRRQEHGHVLESRDLDFHIDKRAQEVGQRKSRALQGSRGPCEARAGRPGRGCMRPGLQNWLWAPARCSPGSAPHESGSDA